MVSDDWQNNYLKIISPTYNNLLILMIHEYTNKFNIINYADDTTLISTINKFHNHSTEVNNNIYQELTNIHNWLLGQRLTLSISKTKFMMFYKPQKGLLLYTNSTQKKNKLK